MGYLFWIPVTIVTHVDDIGSNHDIIISMLTLPVSHVDELN